LKNFCFVSLGFYLVLYSLFRLVLFTQLLKLKFFKKALYSLFRLVLFTQLLKLKIFLKRLCKPLKKLLSVLSYVVLT